MAERYDVVIAGGAVHGASAAWWLTRARPGLRVAVVERDPTYATASTALSVASVRQQFTNAVNVRISRFGIGFIRDFARHLAPHGPDLGLRENGYLFLVGTAEGAKALGQVAAMQRAEGAATEVWDAATLARRFPWLSAEGVSAASFGARDEGWFDNMGLLGGFRAGARAQGATFLHDRVTGLGLKGGRVTSVRLSSGEDLACGALINCTGTRAAEVMAMAGQALPVEPRKRTVFLIDAPNARHPDAPLIIDYQGYYMRPERGQWIIATVPAEDGPCDAQDFDPDAGQFEELIWPAVHARAPGFDAVKVVRCWAGHYAYNRLDQNAVVGLWPGLDNLYLAAGFSGHGLQQAPAVGRALSELILEGAYRSLDLTDLGPQRLLDGTPFRELAIV
ncbi:NAD(P)/FAD-dependent oxidoreductase [Acidimangrovimonas sediminis]|uniref:NAD(P)/FAD-dependent oxidoreductase n=1 Tax=Acidimangrovimonas sediminis TaxID=2056283 RepID=UPI000C7F8B31|nr:FAD-binding oxidoreductase [Acidimangrovimonas sediminis]